MKYEEIIGPYEYFQPVVDIDYEKETIGNNLSLQKIF